MGNNFPTDTRFSNLPPGISVFIMFSILALIIYSFYTKEYIFMVALGDEL